MDVACLFVPNFLVALARRDDPALARRPLVIGGSPDEHARVAACSFEAAEAGVAIGTTLHRALALCPDAVFLPVREGQAAEEAGRLLAFIENASPLVEEIAPGHIHFEVRGLARLAGIDDATFLGDLHRAACELNGLRVRLAGAQTVFAAHAAASVARGVVLQDAATPEFLASLPIEVLPLPPDIHQRLHLFGLDQLGQFVALPRSAVQAQFGRQGTRAWELARGHEDSPIVPRRAEVRVTEEVDLPAPTVLSEPLIAGTRSLLQRALARQEVRGQSLRRLDWRLSLESGEQVGRRFVFREPTADAARMLFVVRSKVERLQLGSAGIALAVTLSGLCSEYGHQSNLWPVGPRRYRELVDAVEQLHARAEDAQVFRIVEVQPWSRIPERQLALVAFGP